MKPLHIIIVLCTALAMASCGNIPTLSIPTPTSSNPAMLTLRSNQEDTRFLAQNADGSWSEIGRGKIVRVPPRSEYTLLRAEHSSYLPEQHSVQPAMREVQFNLWRQPELGSIQLDLRLATAATGDVIAKGRGPLVRSDLRLQTEALVRELLASTNHRSGRLAVLEIKHAGVPEAEGVVTSALSRLAQDSSIELIERQELARLLGEIELQESDIVDPRTRTLNSRIAKELAVKGVDFLVFGSASTVR